LSNAESVDKELTWRCADDNPGDHFQTHLLFVLDGDKPALIRNAPEIRFPGGEIGLS